MSPNTKNTKLIDRGIMPVVILTIVALVSVLLLALTASLTKDARDRQEELMKSENQRLLFPAADAFEPVELTDIEGDLPDVKKVDLAKKGGETIGYVLEVSKGAYGGQLPVLTGVNNDGQVVGVQILDNSETAGIGKKVEDPDYRDQFIGISSSDSVDVDTIAGATVSSASVNSSVREALVAYGVLSGTGELPVKVDSKELIFADGVFEDMDKGEFDDNITAAWTVKDEAGTEIGTLFESTVQGYGGEVPVLTGFDPNGEIVGVALGDNNETEGFGKKWEDPESLEQFAGQKANEALEIDMIAEVTVTSYAMQSGIENAKAAYLALSGEAPPVDEPGDDIKLELFPGATFTALDVSQFSDDGITEAHKSDDGYVVGVEAKGFGGPMHILVGYDLEGVIKGVLLESHGETPGYGKAAEEAEYRDQYIGQKASDEIEVDQIAGSTTTSNAFVAGVQKTTEVYKVIDTLSELEEAPPVDVPEDDIKHELFPGATFTALDVTDVDAKGITDAYKTDDGYVIGAEAQGFGGAMKILVGYDLDGVIKGVLLESHGETPGFGKQAEEAEYRDQYIGQKAADEIEVDQIAGSTVTSKAFVEAVQQTAEVYKIIDTLPELVEEPVDPPAEDDIKHELFPGATFIALDVTDVDAKGITEAYKTDDGYVVGAEAQGFGGAMKILIGYDLD
ncbi:MAG TPA: FMN-binding protein, partial [Fastidiosipila sp.]|nr:FMN-binding protein [Fastidiosipila sp.]